MQICQVRHSESWVPGRLTVTGLNDTNQVRANASVDYLRECDALWVVASIHRIATDKDVDILLQKYGERFRNRIAVLCTRSEVGIILETSIMQADQLQDLYDQQDKIARDLEDKGKDTTEYYRHKEAVRIHTKRVRELKHRCKRLRTYKRKKPSHLTEMEDISEDLLDEE